MQSCFSKSCRDDVFLAQVEKWFSGGCPVPKFHNGTIAKTGRHLGVSIKEFFFYSVETAALPMVSTAAFAWRGLAAASRSLMQPLISSMHASTSVWIQSGLYVLDIDGMRMHAAAGS